MPEELDDTVPNEEQSQETTPDAESSTADETPNPNEGSQQTTEEKETSTEAETDDTADDSADGDSKEGEEDDHQEDAAPPMIPLARHKEILEKERRENGRSKKSKEDSSATTQGTDGDEEEVELTPAAQRALDRRVEQRFQAREEALKQAELTKAFDREVSRLSTKYSGKNGLPKFEVQKVIDHGQKVGIYNIEKAYKDLNEKAIEQAMRKQISKEMKENPPVSSDRPGTSEGAREGSKGQDRVDMHDRSQVVARIRKARQEVEAGRA